MGTLGPGPRVGGCNTRPWVWTMTSMSWCDTTGCTAAKLNGIGGWRPQLAIVWSADHDPRVIVRRPAATHCTAYPVSPDPPMILRSCGVGNCSCVPRAYANRPRRALSGANARNCWRLSSEIGCKYAKLQAGGHPGFPWRGTCCARRRLQSANFSQFSTRPGCTTPTHKPFLEVSAPRRTGTPVGFFLEIDLKCKPVYLTAVSVRCYTSGVSC